MTNQSKPVFPRPNKGIPPAELADDIVARPLMLPDFVNIKPKNPEIAFRWVNFKAGEGKRFNEATFQGFLPATPDDCENHLGMAKDGRVINGDLMLMKIDRKKYLGALRYNNEAVNRVVRKANRETVANQMLKEELGNASSNKATRPEHRGMIQTFTPSPAEVKARIGDEDDGK
jgi:hypothetical protein